MIPLLILYSLDPDSFEKTWQGRTYELFFVWLGILGLILNWDELKASKITRIRSPRTLAFVIFLLIPTLYVVTANFFGLNAAISQMARDLGVGEHWALLIPLSTEYLVFMVLFASIVSLQYGTRAGLRNYSIPTFFLGIIGGLYTIDNLFPYGKFTPFQLIIPATVTLAGNALSMMGYITAVSTSVTPDYGYVPSLTAQNSKGYAAFGIAWPCAGVESLLIYGVTILLFLSKSAIPWKQRTVYFVIGAVVTYFINILRIATIFVIAIDSGWRSDYMPPEVQRFHDYYGMLYSVIWIVSYPLIIMGTRALWNRTRSFYVNRKIPVLTS